MKAGLERRSGPLHAVLVPMCLFLVFTSPWIGLYRRLSASAGWLELAHVGLGLVTLPLGLAYLWACVRGGLWRIYFPWLAGDLGGLGRDFGGLLRGQRPMSEGGGLFAALEGLLLVSLLAAAGTGALWLAAQGAEVAWTLRAVHIGAAWCFAATLAAHALAASLHLVDLLRS